MIDKIGIGFDSMDRGIIIMDYSQIEISEIDDLMSLTLALSLSLALALALPLLALIPSPSIPISSHQRLRMRLVRHGRL